MTAIATSTTIKPAELGRPTTDFYETPRGVASGSLTKALQAIEDNYLMYVWYQQGTGHDLTIKGTPEQITEWAENLIAHVHEAVQAERLRRKAAATAAPEPVAVES